MPDEGATPGVAAVVVAQHEQVAQLAGGGAALGVHRDELAGVGGGVEAAQPDAVGLADEPAGKRGRDGPVADQVGGLVDGDAVDDRE